MLIIRNSNRINSNTFLEEQIPILNDFLSFWTEQKFLRVDWAQKPTFWVDWPRNAPPKPVQDKEEDFVLK